MQQFFRNNLRNTNLVEELSQHVEKLQVGQGADR